VGGVRAVHALVGQALERCRPRRLGGKIVDGELQLRAVPRQLELVPARLRLQPDDLDPDRADGPDVLALHGECAIGRRDAVTQGRREGRGIRAAP